jgi:hypothetical protein
MALEDVPATITSRDEFSEFIRAVLRDWEQSGASWENGDLCSYLEAMAAWLAEPAGYYRNFAPEVNPDVPSWRLFADALLAARVYE